MSPPKRKMSPKKLKKRPQRKTVLCSRLDISSEVSNKYIDILYNNDFILFDIILIVK